jgi:hypothetical protein
MEYTSLVDDILTFDGDLEVRSGTFEFTEITGGVIVTGNFRVFIGTLNMNVAFDMGGGVSNSFSVDGSVVLGPEYGSGGPTLNLNQLTTITSPVTFNLIICSGTGSGEFYTITADNTVLDHGWNTVFSDDIYQVTL